METFKQFEEAVAMLCENQGESLPPDRVIDALWFWFREGRMYCSEDLYAYDQEHGTLSAIFGETSPTGYMSDECEWTFPGFAARNITRS